MNRIPKVAVLIESSRSFGRGLIEGVARYSRLHGPWLMYFEPRGSDVAPPAWLSHWDGDGILARIDDQRMADAVLATGPGTAEMLEALAVSRQHGAGATQ